MGDKTVRFGKLMGVFSSIGLGGEAKSEKGSERGSGVFGFTGWCCFKIWQAALLFFPSSPFYAFMDANVSFMAAVIVLVLAPYGLTMFATDRLSSKRGISFALAVAWLCLVAGLFLQMVVPTAIVPQLVLISATMWGIHLAWQPYAATLRALRLVGARGLVASVAFVALAFVDAETMKIVFWILPFLSIVSLAAHQSFETAESVRFATKEETKSHIDLFIHNPIWNIWESVLQGIGIGLMFAAGITEGEHLLFLGVAMFIAAFLLIAGSKFLLEFNKAAVLIAVIAVMAPLLVAAAFSEGYALAAIGAAAFLIGRFQQGIDVRERFSKPYLELYLFGRRHFLEMFGIIVGAIAATLAFSTGSPFGIRLAFALAVLYVTALCTLVYYFKVIANYESFIYEEENKEQVNQALLEGAEKNRWIRKVNAVAAAADLSPRQIEVLKYLSYGRNAETISKELFISRSTAKSHIYTIYKKIGVHTQQELLDLIQEQPV